jgi:hypothetical protein
MGEPSPRADEIPDDAVPNVIPVVDAVPESEKQAKENN